MLVRLATFLHLWIKLPHFPKVAITGHCLVLIIPTASIKESLVGAVRGGTDIPSGIQNKVLVDAPNPAKERRTRWGLLLYKKKLKCFHLVGKIRLP